MRLFKCFNLVGKSSQFDAQMMLNDAQAKMMLNPGLPR